MAATANKLPLDIKASWLNPIRRLQSVCSKNHGIAVVSMSFLIDADGNPRLWTEPKLTLIEPKANAEDMLSLLLKLLTENEGASTMEKAPTGRES